MDDDDVFKVGFSVVEGCSGAEYQDITDTVKILSNGRLTAN